MQCDVLISRITEQVDSGAGDCARASLTDYLLNIHTLHAYNLEDPLLQGPRAAASQSGQPPSRIRRTLARVAGPGPLPVPARACIPDRDAVHRVRRPDHARSQITFTQMLVVYMMAVHHAVRHDIGHQSWPITPAMKLAQQSANNVVRACWRTRRQTRTMLAAR